MFSMISMAKWKGESCPPAITSLGPRLRAQFFQKSGRQFFAIDLGAHKAAAVADDHVPVFSFDNKVVTR